MNTKISDAIKRLERACIAGMDEEFRDDVQAVLNHLATDAVPVACATDGVLYWNGYSAYRDGHSCQLYTHPQPAALNEVSGNSGELAVYQCPRCSTSMEVDPSAKPSPTLNEVGGDERAQFEAWARPNGYSLVRSEDDYYLTSTQTAWTAWQAALAATGKQPLQVVEAQGIDLSSIANRKLGEVNE